MRVYTYCDPFVVPNLMLIVQFLPFLDQRSSNNVAVLYFGETLTSPYFEFAVRVVFGLRPSVMFRGGEAVGLRGKQ